MPGKGVLGFLLGLALFAFFASRAWTGSLSELGSPWVFAGVGVAMFLAAWVLGMFLTLTVGMASFGWMVGAGLAAFLVPWRGDGSAYVLPLLLHVLLAWLVGHGQAIRENAYQEWKASLYRRPRPPL